MKHLKIIFGFIFTIALAAVPLAVLAQSSIDRQQLIVQRCSELETAIDQLQRRDLVSRTNLGREYESVSREMDALNQRLHANNLDNHAFLQLFSDFNNATSQFRDAYVHYDDGVSKLLGVNCQQHPQDFDTQLASVKDLRGAVDGAATRAASILGQYKTQISQLQVAAKGSAQ